MVILVEHKIILMMLMTEMAFGGMNKSGIGHAGQHSGDDGDESGEVHDGVVSRFNTGVCVLVFVDPWIVGTAATVAKWRQSLLCRCCCCVHFGSVVNEQEVCGFLRCRYDLEQTA